MSQTQTLAMVMKIICYYWIFCFTATELTFLKGLSWCFLRSLVFFIIAAGRQWLRGFLVLFPFPQASELLGQRCCLNLIGSYCLGLYLNWKGMCNSGWRREIQCQFLNSFDNSFLDQIKKFLFYCTELHDKKPVSSHFLNEKCIKMLVSTS